MAQAEHGLPFPASVNILFDRIQPQGHGELTSKKQLIQWILSTFPTNTNKLELDRPHRAGNIFFQDTFRRNAKGKRGGVLKISQSQRNKNRTSWTGGRVTI